MNFQGLAKVENPDFYIDLALGRAKKKADRVRDKKNKISRIEKSKAVEAARISEIKNVITSNFDRIIHSFPRLEELPEFYNKLVRCTLDYGEVRRSLGGINWASKKVKDFFIEYSRKIKKCRDMERINGYRREFYGRVCSFVKQVRKELETIENARKVMKSYPVVKTSFFTVSLVGFPNIGKTTLLYKLTGSKPDIKAYAFTTKGINTAYMKENKIQLLDTPGTLNRLDRMNNIERIAYLAMRHCSNILVYVFDLTEPYPIEEQEKLLEKIRKENIPVIVYLSKTDIIGKKDIENFRKKEKTVSLEELKAILVKKAKEFYAAQSQAF